MKKLISNPLTHDIKWHMANSVLMRDATVDTGLIYQKLAQENGLNSKSNLLAVPQIAAIILPQIGKMLQHYAGKRFDGKKVTLDKLVKEVQHYISKGKVTHEYYILLSLRLSLLATPKKSRVLHKRNNFRGIEAKNLLNYWKGSDRLAQKFTKGTIADHIKKFPDFCYLPTTAGNLTLEDLNKQFGTKTWLIGLTTELTVADDREMHPIHFAWHDASVHLSNFQLVLDRIDMDHNDVQKIMDAHEDLKMQWEENQSTDKIKKLEFVIFMALHESYQCAVALKETLKENTLKCKQSMRNALLESVSRYSDPRWYKSIFPGNTDSNSSIKETLSDLINTVYEPFVDAIKNRFVLL